MIFNTFIVFHTVVEQLGTSASLYSRSIQDDHVCLLVKLMVRVFFYNTKIRRKMTSSCILNFIYFIFPPQNENNIGIEAKGSNPALVVSLLEEIKSIFCPSEEIS